MDKKKPMTDEALVALLQNGLKEAVNYDNKTLSRERAEHLEYYEGTAGTASMSLRMCLTALRPLRRSLWKSSRATAAR